MGIGGGAWWLLVSRGMRARRSMLVVIAFLTMSAVLPVTFVSTVVASGAPRGDELADRLLGPYDLRVQGETLEEARTLTGLAVKGAQSTVMLSTPVSVSTPSHAAAGSAEVGRPEEGYWESRFDVSAGRFPSAAGEVALSDTLAAVMAVEVGESVHVSGHARTIVGLVRERAVSSSRLILSFDDPVSATQGDSASTAWNVFVARAGDLDEASEPYVRRGYGVLRRGGGDSDILVSDGEFTALLTMVSKGLLGWAGGMGVITIIMLARGLRRDLAMIGSAGFGPGHVAALLMIMYVAIAAPVALLSVAAGVGSAAWLRPSLEALGNSAWYAVRPDVPVVGGLALALTSGAALAIVAVTSSGRMSPAWFSRTGAFGHVLGLVGAAVAVSAVVTGRWTFLLGAALLVAPWMALVGAAWLKRFARSRASGESRRYPALLAWASLRADTATVPSLSALIAGLLVAPLTLGLVLAALTGATTSSNALVPRPDVAIYSGGADFNGADLRKAGVEAGSSKVAVWRLATIPLNLGDGLTEIPALPKVGAEACSPAVHGQAGSDTDLCALGLRGVGVGDADALAVVLGRPLRDDERAFVDGGGVLVTDARMVQDGHVAVTPFNVPAGTPLPAKRRAMVVSPAPGTSVSPIVPTVWVSSTAAGLAGLRQGQFQAAFDFGSPVSPDVEQRLRRELVTRLPVASEEEFLSTHLDATRVNLVQGLLSRFGVLSLLIVVCVSTIGSLMFRRSHTHHMAVLGDLGASRRSVRWWHASALSAPAVVGCAAAVVVALVSAWAIVRGEVGATLTVAQVLRLWPVALAPILVAFLAWLAAPRRGQSAWRSGFGHVT